MTASQILCRMCGEKPLIHCISNDIATADTANLLLAAGARPVMSSAPQEAEQISRSCAATSLNCGTPSRENFSGLMAAAKGAQGHPIVIDPVGAGASRWRKENILRLLARAHPAVIHCNYSEALALLDLSADFQGVDSVAGENDGRIHAAQKLAEKYSCTVVITGRQDIVTDGVRTAAVYGGTSLMSLVSGSGCMLTGLLGAFCTAARPFDAALAACMFWKKCAEKAYEKSHRPGSLRMYLTDVAFEIRPQELEEIKVEYITQ